MSSCTLCSRTRPNGICFLAPRTVGCIIGRPRSPVYSTRLPLFSPTFEHAVTWPLVDSAALFVAAIDFCFRFVFGSAFCRGQDSKRSFTGSRPFPFLISISLFSLMYRHCLAHVGPFLVKEDPVRGDFTSFRVFCVPVSVCSFAYVGFPNTFSEYSSFFGLRGLEG